MGTSSSGGGASGSNPLIPIWIEPIGAPPAPPADDSGTDQPDPPSNPQEKPQDNPQDAQPARDAQPPAAVPVPQDGNRFRQPKSDFNKFVRSGGSDRTAFGNAVRGYSKSTGGKTQVLARRMRPSASRVANFYETVNSIKTNGLEAVLKEFNLTSYANRPLVDTLSALSDVIFRDQGQLYENTQDDSITRLAYANTIMRICEEDSVIDLDNLTNEQIEVMTAVFIEETIAQRVLCDLGNKLTLLETDVDKLLEIENNAYQIINGLVRTSIMPEIIATQRGDSKNLNDKIENIYRIAFDALGGSNDK